MDIFRLILTHCRANGSEQAQKVRLERIEQELMWRFMGTSAINGNLMAVKCIYGHGKWTWEWEMDMGIWAYSKN